MDEWLLLVHEDGEQGPGDGDASGQVAFGGGNRVGCGNALEREQCEENEEFGP